MSRRKLLWQNLTFVQESERGNNKFSAVLPQFQNTAAPVKNGVIGENMRSKYWQFLTLYSLQVKGEILTVLKRAKEPQEFSNVAAKFEYE